MVFESNTPVPLTIQVPRHLNTTAKVLVLVSGGGLTTHDEANMEAIAAALGDDTSVDVMVVIPKYTVGATPTPPAYPNGYLAPLDVGCAMGWIGQYGGGYGLATATPFVTMVGYSAGAGIVASVMLASNQFLPPDPGLSISEVHGVFTMSGEYDYKRAELAGDDYAKWYRLHGQPTYTPDTSPLAQGPPATPFSVPWLIEYEQCDADEHYATSYNLTQRLVGGWNGGTTSVYENMVHYATPPAVRPTPGVAVHIDGEYALEYSSSTLYQLLASMIKMPASFPKPSPSPTWEAVTFGPGAPFSSISDVAYGPDGSLWVVSRKPAAGGDFEVGKYANVENAQRCFTEPVDDPGAASHIGVDAAGEPWTVASSGAIATLVGGLIASDPIKGTGSTFSPVTGSATDVTGGGGTLSGTVSPQVYNSYTLPIGSIWITSTTPSSVSPSDYTLQYYAGGSFTTSPHGYGQQIAADSSGAAWVVTNNGQVHTTYSGCTIPFCLVSGQTAQDIGAGGGVTWIAGPSPGHALYFVVPPSLIWQSLMTQTGLRITVSPFGLPAVMTSSNGLSIYHACTWSDGSPGDGSSCPTLSP